MIPFIKVYCGSALVKRAFNPARPFNFHYLAFQDLRTDTPKVLCQSYDKEPVCLYPKCLTTFPLPRLIGRLLPYLHEQTHNYGEQSLFLTKNSKGNEIAMYGSPPLPLPFTGPS